MNKPLSFFIYFSWLAALLLWPAMAPRPAVAAQGASQAPIHIEADKMTSLEKEKAVIFSGNVKAKQGDLLINSDEMTIFHDEEGAQPQAGQGQPQIRKMEARGHVEIVQDDFVATGDEARYYSDIGKVIIIGNAKIIQNNNMVTGHQVEMDLGTGATVVIPDEKEQGRVVGYFYPAGDEDEGNVKEQQASGDKGADVAAPPAPAEQLQQDGPHGDSEN